MRGLSHHDTALEVLQAQCFLTKAKVRRKDGDFRKYDLAPYL